MCVCTNELWSIWLKIIWLLHNSSCCFCQRNVSTGGHTSSRRHNTTAVIGRRGLNSSLSNILAPIHPCLICLNSNLTFQFLRPVNGLHHVAIALLEREKLASYLALLISTLHSVLWRTHQTVDSLFNFCCVSYECVLVFSPMMACFTDNDSSTLDC